MYCEVTRSIRVVVEPSFVPEQSKPQADYYFFAYRVKIINEGNSTVQLMSRHWIITDGNGQSHDVKGPGVIGHQPQLAPGESFEYSSFCPLPTPTGNMRGTYQMVDAQGEYDIKIPLFFLRDLRNIH
jgi:ApaG protein